ncbi:pectinesterase family protein [Penicillium taxi]|uniref:pectinesterase family protein n=1 Tax=Penicillium taxi TaxID=168475 RepID=UPI00254582CD|nr:pectinesterase family protein [Penicillium taxi]KAJ5909227.1 pectinesterase family protein [Penicillium taxi]
MRQANQVVFHWKACTLNGQQAPGCKDIQRARQLRASIDRGQDLPMRVHRNAFEHSTKVRFSGNIITVGTAGAQFTAIQDAVSYAQAHTIPTINVLKGTYPAVTISAIPAVTILGQTKNENDYSQNQVVVSNSGTALKVSTNVKGLTVKNINFINTAPNDGAVVIRGRKNAFYQCQFISSRSMGITTNLGIGLIANSYIKAADTIISGKGTLYVFNTVIVPSGSSTVIAFNQGTTVDDTLYNSTMVFDRNSIVSRDGDNHKVFLAGAKRAGSVVIYRNSALGSSVVTNGVSIDRVLSKQRSG